MAIGIASALGLVVSGVRLRPAAIGIILALSSAAAVPRRHVVAAALMLCAAVLASGLIDDFASENGALFLGLAVVCYSLGTRPDRVAAGLATGCLFACCQALQVTIGEPLSPPMVFVTFGSSMLGRIVESRRLLVGEMAARQREVSDESKAYSALVVDRERARIARDLHDIVAHCIAVMVIQAGAGRLTSTASREQATAAFIRIREAGSEALAEMQKTRRDARPSRGGRQRESTTRGANAPGSGRRAQRRPPRRRLGRRRNSVPHRPGGTYQRPKTCPWGPVAVSFRQLETEVVIEVTNARMSPGYPRIGFETSRRGLSGMRERVEAIGVSYRPEHSQTGAGNSASGINVPLQSPTTC